MSTLRPRRDTNESERGSLEAFRGQGILGTFLMIVGVAVAVLAVGERTTGLPFSMPRSWYINPHLWYMLALAAFVGGIAVMRQVGESEESSWRPERPGRRFDRVVLYSRPGCHLCDIAHDVLMRYREWLPEVEEVNIDTDPALVERYGTSIPVIECDGQIRFRGQVDELLLRRLIEGTTPQ